MIGCSPIDAHPLPGTSRFIDTYNMDSCTPPPYDSTQPPPPYPSRKSSTTLSSQPRTRSIPFSSGIQFEWNPNIPKSPEDIIIVTVRVNQMPRSDSFDDSLPERPPPRSLLRRLTSHLSLHDGNNKWDKLRAVRMPRYEYLRHHKRDTDGNYAGSEPEQNWDDARIAQCYARYQHHSLNGLYQNATMRM